MWNEKRRTENELKKTQSIKSINKNANSLGAFVFFLEKKNKNNQFGMHERMRKFLIDVDIFSSATCM